MLRTLNVTRRFALCSAAIIVLAAGSPAALAQQTDTPQRDRTQPDRTQQPDKYDENRPVVLMLSEDIIGKNVFSAYDETIGSIRDLIVDAPDGKVKYAIVEVGAILGLGGKSVAVPMSQLRWDRADEKFALGISEAQLKEFPAFEASKWRELERDDWVNALRAHRFDDDMEDDDNDFDDDVDDDLDDDRDDVRDDDRDIDDDAGVEPVGSLIRVTDVTGTTIQSPTSPDASNSRQVMINETRTKVGEIDGVVVDLESSKVPFILVSTGGILGFGEDDRLVPWKAMMPQGEGIMLSGITEDQFKNLKPITREEIREVQTRDQLEQWCEPFDIDDMSKDKNMDDDRKTGGG